MGTTIELDGVVGRVVREGVLQDVFG